MTGSGPGFSREVSADNSCDRLVFLHIPKTSGSTLHHILKENFLDEEVCPERLGGISYWPSEALKKYKYFSMHTTFYSLNHIPDNRKVITILREPIDRLLSQYEFWRSHSATLIENENLHFPRLAKYYNLKKFLRDHPPMVRTKIDNIMCRFLTDEFFNSDGVSWRSDEEMLDAARENLGKLSVLGFAEYMPQSIDLICRQFDFAAPQKIERINSTRDNWSQNPEGFDSVDDIEIDDETEELLVHFNRLDSILYKEALDVFTRKIGTGERPLRGFNVGAGKVINHYQRTVVAATEQENGYLLFGPYLRLIKGSYRVIIDMKFDGMAATANPDDVLAAIDAVSSSGSIVHGHANIYCRSVQCGEYQRHVLTISLEKTVSDMEIRVYKSAPVNLSVDMAVKIVACED